MPPRLVLFFLGCLAAGAVAAAPFLPPAEGPVPFRRDRLPLEIRTIEAVADDLRTLAARLNPEAEALEERRHQTQVLALALALAPDEPQLLAMRARLEQEGAVPSNVGEEALQGALDRLWQVRHWLASPPSGADGRALADCLGDVLAFADPSYPDAGALAAAGESGRWQGWVPDLESYLPPPDEDDEASEEAMAFVLTQANIRSPLWAAVPPPEDAEEDADGNDGPTQRSVVIGLRVVKVELENEEETTPPLSILILRTEESSETRAMKRRVLDTLAGIHGELPRGYVAEIAVEGGEYLIRRNHGALGVAMLVLIDSALRGDPPETTVIGGLDEEGGLILPHRFWDKLRSLSDGPGGRLILPAEAAAYLPSILALEDPEFFIRYEVLLAENLEHFLRLSRAESADENQALAAQRFEDIRTRLGGQELTHYVANRFVRQRLAELAADAPHHFSARMLAIQGAGERPSRLPRNLLAAELRRAILPVQALVRERPQDLVRSVIDSTYEASRQEVDRLERYVDIRDRDLHTRIKDFVTSLRSMSRSMSRESNPNTLHAQLSRSHIRVLHELTLLCEDEEPSVLAALAEQVEATE